MMSDNDQGLIDQANNCYDWGLISYLEEQAESDECKDELHNRKVDLYNKEENLNYN